MTSKTEIYYTKMSDKWFILSERKILDKTAIAF